MKLGYTGTRSGMTAAQKASIRRFVEKHAVDIDEVHHGDCIGGDDEFDSIIRELAKPGCNIIAHPSNVEPTRAYVDCKEVGDSRRRVKTTMLPERPPILRDCDIVDAVDTMIAAPRTYEEQAHSGTWFTYKYANKHKRKTYMIFPDGRTV